MTVIKCPWCGLEFRTISGIKRHIRLMHDQHVCPICGKWFRKLSVHLGKCNDEAHRRAYAIIGLSSRNRKVREVRDVFLWER
jgi:uncharacterized C2H2 Zn-finger protein